MGAHTSLVAELEATLKEDSSAKRVATLRRITELFLNDASQFSEAQIEAFDDVLCVLIRRIETRALAELSALLAPIGNAPIELMRKLARNDDIVVAGPVLTQSARLTTADLIDIAHTKSSGHLLALSGRPQLEPAVTDELLQRGDAAVTQKLANNHGARFSDQGFNCLVGRAQTDETLAKTVGLRVDLPLNLLQELVRRATTAVREWLLAHAPRDAKAEIERVVAAAAADVGQAAAAPRDFTRAQQLIAWLNARGELTEAAIAQYATRGQYEEVVAGLAQLSATPIQIIAIVMRSDRNDGLLIPCKAAGLSWSTVSTILRTRFAYHRISERELTQSKCDFLNLSQHSAQRTLRFWKVRTDARSADEAGGLKVPT